MIRTLFCSIILAAALAAAPALAQSFDGTWHGRMTCARMSFTKGVQKVRFVLTVAKGHATFVRHVYDKDNSTVVGSEEGGGTVAGDGAIALTATWRSAKANSKFSYTASYRGRLSGHTARLSGTQAWTHNGKREDRHCTIALTR
jgi:hypothetical protein